MTKLSDKPDLTRWNRSGLSRFQYVDGNAITYTETLRQAMVEAFTRDGTLVWQELNNPPDATTEETPRQRQNRWTARYQADRQDYAWEILRSYARATHVLSEHLNAYANESYIGTATQWNNVRRLVTMLDYQPAPAASAQTHIALLAKTAQSGVVEKGFAFKNKPLDGSPPAIFETLDDLEIDPQLNQLKAKDWNKSQLPFVYPANGQGIQFPLAEPLEAVSVGSVGILLINQAGIDFGVAVTVTSINEQWLVMNGEARPGGLLAELRRHQIRLQLKPAYHQQPQLNGSDVVRLNEGHGVQQNSKITWQQSGTWVAASVLQVEGNKVRLSGTLPSAGAGLYQLLSAQSAQYSEVTYPTRRVILPLSANRYADALFSQNLQRISSVQTEKVDGRINIYDYLNGTTYDLVYYLPKNTEQGSDTIAIVQQAGAAALIFDGSPQNLASGDWVVAQTVTGLRAVLVDSLSEQQKSYSLTIIPSLSSLTSLIGDFATELRPLNDDINAQPVFATDMAKRASSHSILTLQSLPESVLLATGRRLIIQGKYSAVQATLKSVDRQLNEVKIEPALPGSELTGNGISEDFTCYDTVIYANVVASGHGESQAEKILGSGDATQSSQTFDFAVDDVSFESDGNFPAGMRCAIDIKVDGRTWRQVANLSDSSADAADYQVRIKEDGSLKIIFGDGSHGRRLPSGNNNLRIRHKVGTGLSGNLPPFSLNKALKPHFLIDSVVQPIASSGGNDMETLESMRDNAPASVLTLERAVSLSDFSYLAAANSSVWQARAFSVPPGKGRKEQINVAVVPAGGGSLGTLAGALQDFLMQHALPAVQVSVIPYEAIIYDLSVVLRVRPDEFDPEIVAQSTRQHLLDKFSLRNSKLGEPLYRSQLFQAVEEVQGVANCQVVIATSGFRNALGQAVVPWQVASSSEGVIKRISAQVNQLIYLDPALSLLSITTQPFTL